MRPRPKQLAALLLLPLISAAAPPEDYAEPYRILAEANRTLDPSLAASAYTADGELVFEYPGQSVERFRGTEAIRGSYVRTFGQIDQGQPIELEFRFDPPGLKSSRQTGAYRVIAYAGGQRITAFGRFSVKLVKQAGAWRFAEDRGTVATGTDFEALPPAKD